MNEEILKPFLAGMARHALTTLGGVLVTDGVMTSGEMQGFVGAGMVLLGIGWSWWQKVGHAKAVAELANLKAKG